MTEPGKVRLGVAFGGGVARGNFQLGALRALEEAGIQFDCFAGTSSGSISASVFAGGASQLDIEKMSQSVKWFQDVFNLKNSTLNMLVALRSYLTPKGAKTAPPGFLESSRLVDFVNRAIGGRTFSTIEKLILTAADIVTGEKILFCSPRVARELEASGKLLTGPADATADVPGEVREGSWEANYVARDVVVPFEDVGLAVQASCCFPGVFSSVPVDCPDLAGNVRRRILNDGGLCEQVPVKPLKALGCDKVLAIFVGFVPQFKEVNNFMAVTSNSIQYLIRTQIVESLRLADYVLYDPRIEDTSVVTLDTGLVQTGYTYTKERIPEIVRALGIES